MYNHFTCSGFQQKGHGPDILKRIYRTFPKVVTHIKDRFYETPEEKKQMLKKGTKIDD